MNWWKTGIWTASCARRCAAASTRLLRCRWPLSITAQCFQMDHELGSITPGKCADIVFLDDLHDFRVSRVMIDGTVVAEEGAPTFQVAPFAYPEWAVRSMHVRDKVTPASFTVELPKGASVRGGRAIVRAIEVAPGSIGTKEVRVELAVRHGSIQADPAHDVLKAFVFERHRATGANRLWVRARLRHPARRHGVHGGARRA